MAGAGPCNRPYFLFCFSVFLPLVGAAAAAVTTTGAPSARYIHTAVWTGSELIVWGGGNGANTGGRYDPAGDSWMPLSNTDAPGPRNAHTAIWTGSEMIVWGGMSNVGSNFDDGGRKHQPVNNHLADGGGRVVGIKE